MEPRDQAFFDGFDTRNASLLRQSVHDALVASVYECVLHPLGFYLIRLAARGDTTVRLHYWPAYEREDGTAITPYHDHVWALTSCILFGSLENVLLELHTDTSGDFQVAEINQVGNVDEVVPASYCVQLSVKSNVTYRIGEFYEILPREFHYTNVQPQEATLTVVRAKVVAQGGPRTLLPVGSAGHRPSRGPTTKSERVAEEIIRLLGAASSS
ncbi:MAG: hypothetical protein QOC81_4873 [Thermoanaerobaculia bacterium]|nr:hypothetical protein [Thermoanaerobaculia bacterium]